MNQELNGLPQKVERAEILKGWEQLQQKMKVNEANKEEKPKLRVIYAQPKWRQHLSKWIRRIKGFWNK